MKRILTILFLTISIFSATALTTSEIKVKADDPFFCAEGWVKVHDGGWYTQYYCGSSNHAIECLYNPILRENDSCELMF